MTKCPIWQSKDQGAGAKKSTSIYLNWLSTGSFFLKYQEEIITALIYKKGTETVQIQSDDIYLMLSLLPKETNTSKQMMCIQQRWRKI